MEKLRRDAARLEEDKDSLLASLDSVRNADIVSDLVERKCFLLKQFKKISEDLKDMFCNIPILHLLKLKADT